MRRGERQRTVRLSRTTTVLPDPVTWRASQLSSKKALAPRLQMCGLETISTTRQNGRGPDSSLKRLWVFVWIHVYTVAALWTVTH